MATYLITYDLNKEASRPNIVKHLKDKFDGWAKLSESSYAVETALSPPAIFDHFKPILDSNDNLYVITLSRPYSGQGPKDVNEWLANNLP